MAGSTTVLIGRQPLCSRGASQTLLGAWDLLHQFIHEKEAFLSTIGDDVSLDPVERLPRKSKKSTRSYSLNLAIRCSASAHSRKALPASRSSASLAAPSRRCSTLVWSSGRRAFRYPVIKRTASSRLWTTMSPFSVRGGSNLYSDMARGADLTTQQCSGRLHPKGRLSSRRTSERRPLLKAADLTATAIAADPSGAVRRRVMVTDMGTILCPPPDVARHIVETKPVGGERADRRRLLIVPLAAAAVAIGVVLADVVTPRIAP